MSSVFEQYLEKYAEIVLKVGLNLQPGQRLIIDRAPLELAPLVRLIAAQAYKNGAKLVDVVWRDERLELVRYQHASRDTFEAFPTWQTDGIHQVTTTGGALLSFNAVNPGIFKEQDPELVAMVQKTRAMHFEPINDLIDKRTMNWLVISAPVEGWAEKMFPDLSPEKGRARFWDILFDICRVKVKDPIYAWQEHVNQLTSRSQYLTNKQYKALKFTAPGTNLTVGLPRGHIWRAANWTTQSGISFIPNIPTEEVFTIPHKDKTEGVVTATRPLELDGVLIEGFCLEFSEGRVVKATARKGEDNLHKLLETDEGARRLGEVALIPHSSPISQTGLLFYYTLIEEIASSHIALGDGYKFSLEGGEGMSDDDFKAVGGNCSLRHVDFMIGSDEMNLDGITGEGTVEPVMRGGEWVN
jgi:aminopeptidase